MIDNGSATAVTRVARRSRRSPEDKDDDDREERPLDQRLHRRAIVAELVVDLGVDLGEGHLRMLGADFGEPLRHSLIDGDVACALGAGYAEGDDRLVEQPGEGARLGRAIDHGSELIEPHLAPARQRNRQRGEIGDAARPGEGADRLLLAGDLAATAPEVDVVGPHLFIDRRRGDPERQQLQRIERDADLAIDPAEARHFPDAADALQVARDRIVDEPRQLLDRHPRGGGGVGDDRQPFNVDPTDDRLVDCAR